MSLTVEQLVENALALPGEARALLADRLVESLDPANDEKIRKLWITEARRRQSEIRSGKVKVISRAEVSTRLKRTIAK